MNTDFHDPRRIAIVGATGGIGAALLGQLLGEPGTETIYALARRPERLAPGSAIPLAIDTDDEASIARAAERIHAEGPLDLVVVTTGLLHGDGGLRPEKSMRALDPQVLARVLATNCIGPALVAKHFLPGMRKQSKSVFATLSARVGSISDNRLGGWYSYRAAKAALNQTIRTLSIEHARTHREAVVVSLHPGTVATRLSAPFQRGVPAGQLFSPEQAASHLLTVIDGLTAEHTGGFFAWDGQSIDY